MMPHVSLEEILNSPPEHYAGCDRAVECELIRREYRHCREFVNDNATFSVQLPQELREEAIDLAVKMSFGAMVREKASMN